LHTEIEGSPSRKVAAPHHFTRALRAAGMTPPKLTPGGARLDPVRAPEPLIVSWQGRELRIRHDDSHLGPHTPRGAVIRSAIELASDVDGLRLVLASTLGDRYRVRVSDDGSTVRLWRLG
jgi:hypothetical protein